LEQSRNVTFQQSRIVPLGDNASSSTTTRKYLDGIASITPVSYQWNDIASQIYRNDTTTRAVGLIAQDVELVFPELVSIDSNGYKQLDFASLPFYVMQAVKELWGVVTGQGEKINELKARLEYLESLETSSTLNVNNSNTTETILDNTSDINEGVTTTESIIPAEVVGNDIGEMVSEETVEENINFLPEIIDETVISETNNEGELSEIPADNINLNIPEVVE